MDHVEHVTRCWGCRRELAAGDLVRSGSCPGCGRDTRVCRNCTFYDPGRHNDCREVVAERVVDKERANFCDLFRAAPLATATAGPDPETEQARIRKRAEALFGGG